MSINILPSEILLVIQACMYFKDLYQKAYMIFFAKIVFSFWFMQKKVIANVILGSDHKQIIIQSIKVTTKLAETIISDI